MTLEERRESKFEANETLPHVTERLDENRAGVARHAVAGRIPDWTDGSQHDPGITVLEVLAYVLDAAVSYTTIDHERAVSAVARISDAASRLEVPVTADVTVDGDRWTRVARLDDFGTEDRVFSLDPDGRVVFGDGVHGRRPAAGNRIAYARAPELTGTSA